MHVWSKAFGKADLANTTSWGRCRQVHTPFSSIADIEDEGKIEGWSGGVMSAGSFRNDTNQRFAAGESTGVIHWLTL
jgi:hypothetical protein